MVKVVHAGLVNFEACCRAPRMAPCSFKAGFDVVKLAIMFLQLGLDVVKLAIMFLLTEFIASSILRIFSSLVIVILLSV